MHYDQVTEQPGGIQLFTHPSFGTIRTAGSADNPLFCLRDLCKTLGLDPSAVRRRLSDGVTTNHLIPDAKGRTQRTTFVSEPGMYKVIFQSRKPEAEAFTDWVTSVVLPSIRKTGHYGVAPADPTTASLEEFKRTLVASMQELVIKTVSEALKTYMPAPAMIPPTPSVTRSTTEKTWSLGEMGKELGVDSYYLKNLLVSINAVKATRHEVVSATKRTQNMFANLPYWVPFRGGVERWDGILVTEKGREEILTTIQVYKKQKPYIK